MTDEKKRLRDKYIKLFGAVAKGDENIQYASMDDLVMDAMGVSQEKESGVPGFARKMTALLKSMAENKSAGDEIKFRVSKNNRPGDTFKI